MTYRQAFDRLGNPVARPSRAPIGHRLLQGVSLVISIVLLFALYGANKP
jgi:hypothetical protein